MLVQQVLPPDGGAESWTVLNDDFAVVEPIDLFLAHLSAIERSPTTVRSYAFDLRDYFAFLDGHRIDWVTVRLEHLGRFVAWLRLSPNARSGAVTVLPTVAPHWSATTLNRKLSVTWNLAAAETISLRYDHGLRRCVGHGSAGGEVAGAGPARAGGRLASRVGRSRACAPDVGRLRSRAGRVPRATPGWPASRRSPSAGW